MGISIWLAVLAMEALGAPWHQSLALAGGGVWRTRVPVTVTNASDRAAAGALVSVRVGKGEGEADIAGTAASSVRLCAANGDEMLYDLVSPTGQAVRRGLVPAGAVLTLPVECPARGEAVYYVYCDNPRAWAVPDFLAGGGTLRNGGVEDGEGDTPTGWQHDAADADHRASWTTETSHSGTHSLKTVVTTGAEPTWIATRQTGLRLVAGARYRMTAWVKARDVVGDAGWYIHAGSAENPMLTSPMLLAGAGTYDWKQVTVEFTAPPGADRADLGTVLRGTGTAWFDDVSLERLDGGEEPLKARAGPAERMLVREAGSTDPWPTAQGAASAAFRTPVRVANLGDSPAAGLVSVDLPAALGRFQGKVPDGALRVVSGGKVAAHHRLGASLLFTTTIPAHTVLTTWVYFAPGGARPAASGGSAPGQYAANPALPGAGPQAASGVPGAALRDYAALLASPLNLARNPSFEEGAPLPSAWAGGAEGTRPAGAEMGVVEGGLFGRRCGRIHVPAGSQPAWIGWRQDVPVKPGHTYLYAAWLRCKDLQGGLQLHAHLLTAAGELVKQNAMTGAGPAISGTQGWMVLSGVFTVPDDCERFQMHLTMLATGTAWHDGVLLCEVTPGQADVPVGRPGVQARGIAVWPVNAIVKVFREDVPPTRPGPARITCARNEREPLQLAVRSVADVRGVRVTVSPPTRADGAALHDVSVGAVGYVPIDHVTNYYSNRTPAYYRKTPSGPAGSDGWPGWWPDPLLPLPEGRTLNLAAGRTQPVWVTVHVPASAAPGDYRGTVRFAAGGRVLASVPFTVHVWGFALPEQRHLKAVYDCRQSDAMWQVPGRTEQQTREAFWRFMADHGVCPDRVQPEPTLSYRDGKVTADFTAYDRAAKVYFEDLKLPHSYTPGVFYLFGWGHLPADRFGEAPYEGEYPYTGADRGKLRPAYRRAYQACLKAYWDHVKAKGWADRITLYVSDEPFDSEPGVRAQMKAICEMIHEVDPAIPVYSSTWHHQPEWDGSLNVWGIGHYGVVPVQKMRDLQAAGDTIWWTTDGQMCTDTPCCAIERLLPHYCDRYGARAYEFWGIDWLTYDPYRYGWHSFLLHDYGPGTPQDWVRYPNGDGFLAYPPGPLKLGEPVSSVRLEQAREGVEDYEYLYLLRDLVRRARAAGRDTVEAERALALADSLAPSPCEIGRYSTRILPDPDRVFAVKEAVARAIERLGR